MAKGRSPKRDPDPDPTLCAVTPLERTPIDRAYQLARSGCNDAEVAATLVAETDLDPDDAEQLIAAPEMARRLDAERLAGRGALRAYLFAVATAERPTYATLQVATWLSRQLLGYGARGLPEDVARAAARFDEMSPEQLREELRRMADGA